MLGQARLAVVKAFILDWQQVHVHGNLCLDTKDSIHLNATAQHAAVQVLYNAQMIRTWSLLLRNAQRLGYIVSGRQARASLPHQGPVHSPWTLMQNLEIGHPKSMPDIRISECSIEYTALTAVMHAAGCYTPRGEPVSDAPCGKEDQRPLQQSCGHPGLCLAVSHTVQGTQSVLHHAAAQGRCCKLPSRAGHRDAHRYICRPSPVFQGSSCTDDTPCMRADDATM